MVRDREGQLRVFQNICRHRGMILIEKPGKIRRAIRCPYHSWCYELDGRLRAGPVAGRTDCPLCTGQIKDMDEKRYLPPECAA